LPSTIVSNLRHNVLEAAYLYYYATDTAFVEKADEQGLLKRRLTELIGDAVILADQAKFDVFNALTLMDNTLFLQDLKVTRPYRTDFLNLLADESRTVRIW
jgi:glycylpeptide N-tetradecanoyltransferase